MRNAHPARDSSCCAWPRRRAKKSQVRATALDASESRVIRASCLKSAQRAAPRSRHKNRPACCASSVRVLQFGLLFLNLHAALFEAVAVWQPDIQSQVQLELAAFELPEWSWQASGRVGRARAGARAVGRACRLCSKFDAIGTASFFLSVQRTRWDPLHPRCLMCNHLSPACLQGRRRSLRRALDKLPQGRSGRYSMLRVGPSCQAPVWWKFGAACLQTGTRSLLYFHSATRCLRARARVSSGRLATETTVRPKYQR